ncbi:MAG: VWA domain-containing protein [Flexilinea sp.]
MAKKRVLGISILFLVLRLFISAQTVDNFPVFRSFFFDDGITLFFPGLTENQPIQFNKAEVLLDQTRLEDVYFSSIKENSYPINILFLIDISKTVYNSDRELPAELINQFLNDPSLNDRSLFGIMVFNDSDNLILYPTNNRSDAMAAANTLSFESASSNFSLAILNALYFIDKNPTGFAEKNQIILITDGTGYNDERTSEKEIADKLRSTGISLSVLMTRNTNTGSYDSNDFNRLQRLASGSGGIAVTTEKENLALEYEKIMMDPILRTYTLTGRIPSTFIPAYNDSVLISLSLFNNDLKIAEATKTVRPPSSFFPNFMQEKTLSEVIASSTLVPVDSINSNLSSNGSYSTYQPIPNTLASLVPMVTSVPTGSAQQNSLEDNNPSLITNTIPTWQPLSIEEITGMSTLTPDFTNEPTSTITFIPLSPTVTFTKTAVPAHTVSQSPTASVTSTRKPVITATIKPTKPATQVTPSKAPSTATSESILPVTQKTGETSGSSACFGSACQKTPPVSSGSEPQNVIVNLQKLINGLDLSAFQLILIITVLFVIIIILVILLIIRKNNDNPSAKVRPLIIPKENQSSADPLNLNKSERRR